MTATYSGDPATSALDEVRFHIGDTDMATPLLTDAEIDFVIATWDPIYMSNLMTAAACCEAISAKYAGQVSVSADGVSVSLSDLQAKYTELSATLRLQYSRLNVAADGDFAGAMYDTDWDYSIKPLMFGLGFMDNPDAGRQDYGHPNPRDLVRYDSGVPGVS